MGRAGSNFMPTKFSSVCYHYLERTDEFHRIWGHSFELFREHIAYYQANYELISQQQLEEGEFPSGKKSLLLTFDDGLQEHTKIIAPYLNSLGISALFSVPTCIFRNQPANPQILHFGMAFYGVRKFYNILFGTVQKNFSDYLSFLPNNPDKFGLMELHGAIKSLFRRTLPVRTARQILINLYNEYLLKDCPDFMNKVHLQPSDITELVRLGHYLAAHTDSHCVVSQIADNQDLVEAELAYPRRELAKRTGTDVYSFAYPFGSSEDILKSEYLIEKMGYKLIFTTFKGGQNFNRMQIGRYCSQSQDSIACLKKNLWEYDII